MCVSWRSFLHPAATGLRMLKIKCRISPKISNSFLKLECKLNFLIFRVFSVKVRILIGRNGILKVGIGMGFDKYGNTEPLNSDEFSFSGEEESLCLVGAAFSPPVVGEWVKRLWWPPLSELRIDNADSPLDPCVSSLFASGPLTRINSLQTPNADVTTWVF